MEKEAIQNKEKNFVSCVLYLHNDGKNIREFLKTVCGNGIYGLNLQQADRSVSV